MTATNVVSRTRGPEAARRTGALLQVHTEKCAWAERVCTFLTARGVSPVQLVLCHMDKLPELAEPKMYHSSGGGAGLASLPGEIRARLIEKDSHEAVQKLLLGGNIARRSAGLHES